MRPKDHHSLETLRLFLTVDHACGYLVGQQARNLVADPEAVDQVIYDNLARMGFRRSGGHIYRPHCAHCEACQSLRVAADDFTPNRSQRRVWQRNQDLQVTILDSEFCWEHFYLFERYLKSRHPHGGMDNASPESYLDFITSDWSDTMLVEFRDNINCLLAVAVVDRLADGLSAVYTFFDPDATRRSPGTLAILWEIQEARRLGLDWVYLGYWIADCEKMRYKSSFTPHQIFLNGRWIGPPA